MPRRNPVYHPCDRSTIIRERARSRVLMPEELRRLRALDEFHERSFNFSVGRIAGVTGAQTRDRLLRAAACAFAERGYDGTRVADIAAAAGVSNGALYAHFASKADLLVNALRTHGRRLLADLLAADPDRSITDLL